MTTTVSTIPDATQVMSIPRWATVLFVIATALQAIDGASGLPSAPAFVLAALSAGALYFIVTGKVQYAVYAMAAALLTVWVRMLADANPEASPADVMLILLPVVAIAAAILAWRKRLPTLAAVLVSVPTLLSVVLAFALGVVAA